MSSVEADSFSQANKSVDDLLKEIDSQSPELKASSSLNSIDSGNISSTGESQSDSDHLGSTLKGGYLSDGISNGTETRISSNCKPEIALPDLSLNSATEPLKVTSSKESGAADESLQREPGRKLSGPRPLDDDEQNNQMQTPVVLKSDENGLMKTIPTIHRPLPTIQPSPSDYSIRSMPNIANNPLTSTEKPDLRNVSGGSTDSEKTIALSPRSQALNSFYDKEVAEPSAGLEPQSALEKTPIPDLSKNPSFSLQNEIGSESSDDSDASTVPAQSILSTEIVNKSMVATNKPAAGKPVSRDVIGRRSVSAISSSTTMTSESDFVSASEGGYTDGESDGIGANVNGSGLGNGIGFPTSISASSGFTDGNETVATVGDRSDTDVEPDATISNSSSMSISTTVHQLSEKPEAPFEKAADTSLSSSGMSEQSNLSGLDDNSGASVIHHTELLDLANAESGVDNGRMVSQSTVSTTSTFDSRKFVLEDPHFNPDDTSHALDGYQYDPTLKVAPIDGKAANKGISVRKLRKDTTSDEVAPRESILDIWSKQEMFRRVSSHSDDFQSLGEHGKARFLVKSKPPKFVRVIPSSKIAISPSPSSKLYSNFGPAWVKSRMEVLPSGELNKSVNLDTAVYEERDEASISADSSEEASTSVDEQSSGTDDEGSLSEYEDAKRDLVESTVIGESNEDVHDVEKVEPQSSQKESDESAQSSSCSFLDESIDLGKYLKHPLDKSDNEEDLFASDWVDVSEENFSLNTFSGAKTTNGTDCSGSQLTQLWRNGTLKQKPEKQVVKEDPGDKFVHLSVKEMESFMIRKKMTKEKFQIKNANGTAEVVSNISFKPEQKGQMVDEPSAEVESIASALISDLAIQGGIQGEEKTELIDDLEADHLLKSFEIEKHDDTCSVTLKEVSPTVDAESVEPKKESPADNGKKNSQKAPKKQEVNSPRKVKEPESMEKQAETRQPDQIPEKAHLVDGEQGRLFLKLQGLESLRLPDVENRKAKFKIVIDNGIHVLSTEFFDIKRRNGGTTINKEFELVVPEKLNIVITLKLKYEKMQNQLVEVHERKRVKSKNIFSKMFGGNSIVTTTKYVNMPAKYDPLSECVATDGSFAKIQINFDNFKDEITGEVGNFVLDGFNEWRMVKVGKNLKPRPFNICKLRAEMLFVPRKSKYEILPLSIKNAMKQVEEIGKTLTYKQEGYMYQEGGDIDVWTRRYFKLKGYDLYAHNVDTMKLKAKINLRKVVYIDYPGKKPVDGTDSDAKSQVSASSATSDNTKRSSQRIISETLILNNGFKLRFANGESIDLGCDSKQERTVWVSLIEDIITKNNFRCQPWVRLMSKKMAERKECDHVPNSVGA